ncbi:TonB-dependent siderophore receptor [Veronia pacifica]|uniref:Ligand-gated channel protein n=1 Tax=Veronia pacifica TaxID=1080227 RepID=A0A1C3ESF5_9GAMM|nr:TonB-dependent siderophore receptor [Veronia pacifica]ODA36180.1 ligand-gated channel protein [Veronia pacifica]
MRTVPICQRTTLLLGLMVSTIPVAYAENIEEQSSLDTVTVFGKAYRNTATKTALEPDETPQSITVIDGDLMQQRGVKSLNQSLRYAPGVVTETKGSSVTMYDNFYLRGFRVEQAYFDGLLLQNLKNWNLQPQIDPIAIQQIEIFKGPTSVLYGSMPPGGMINMIAKAPQSSSSSKVSISAGSRNLLGATIDSTGPIENTDLSYRFIALTRKQDSQVDNATEERYVVAPSLNWQINDSTDLGITLYYQNDPSMGINSSLPASGMFIENPLGSVSPSTSAGDENWSEFTREVFLAGYKLNHEFSDDWSFLQNARYVDGKLSQKNTYHTCYVFAGVLYCNFDETTGVLQRNIYTTDESLTGFTVDNQFSGEIIKGNIEHNVLFGVDYQYMTGISDYAEFRSSDPNFYGFNIFNPDNDLLSPATLTESHSQNDRIRVEQIGVYLQDQVRMGSLILLAGGRYDIYKSRVLSKQDGRTNESSTDQDEFSFRLGALYTLDSGIAPYISYATSFEPTAGNDTKGKPFKPETSDQWEIGAKYQSDDGNRNASLSVFRITKSDALIVNPGDYRDPQLQIGELTSDGIELQTQWGITENLLLSANYTYSDKKITKDSIYQLKGTTPIYIPDHAASLWASYNIDKGRLAGTRLSGGARYVGEMQMDATNTQGKVPAYTSVDLSVGYDLGGVAPSLSGTTANLAVNNAFDEESYTCFDKTNCWYGAERSVELTVEYEF